MQRKRGAQSPSVNRGLSRGSLELAFTAPVYPFRGSIPGGPNVAIIKKLGCMYVPNYFFAKQID
jgi:hypothetical protein